MLYSISARKLLVIAIGIIIGLLSVFSPGSVFILSTATLLILLIRFKSDVNEKGFLTIIFISGLSVRVILLLLVSFVLILQNKWYSMAGDRTIAIFGDSGYYTLRSWWLMQSLIGKPLNNTALKSILDAYGQSGHLYLLVLFYYLFGFSLISVTLINCILSVLTGIFYYFIAKEVVGIRAAKLTAILVVFFPSLILWSITNLKDPLFICLSGAFLWSFLHFLKTNKIRFLVFLILTVLLQSAIRAKFILPVFLLSIFGFCYLLIKNKRRHILLLTIILIFISPFLKARLDQFKNKVINYHQGVISSKGFVYHIYDDWVYEVSPENIEQIGYPELFKGLVRGWFHYFLEPFPWKISSRLSLFSLPQIIIWYLLLPFSILGILMQLRYNWHKSLALIVYFFVIGCILSLTGGNIGTDFRMRDMLTPILLLFSAIGLCVVFSSKKDDHLAINK